LTAEWVQQLTDGADARTITLQQIQTYQEDTVDYDAD